MKRIMLSTMATLAIANATDLGTITVEEKINEEVVQEINTKEVKNADLAEALAKKSASISMIRRSGIANDIILRGQKRDNIKITVDDAVVHGACPNRMDPPTSHVITSNVDSVTITEGPFDVEEFGNLSGGIKVKTAKPTKELSGEAGITLGSFGYQKINASVSGGNDTLKALVVFSKEESEQYEDGDGNTLAEQTYNAVNGTSAAGTRYADEYTDINAFEKQSVMVKGEITLDDSSEFTLSATKNESDTVLYPSSKMDAAYDDSNIYSVNYSKRELGKLSKKLEIKAYKSDVDHPMDNSMRVSGSTTYMTNHLTTEASGVKIINSFDAIDREFTVGFDSSSRNWDGKYYNSLDKSLGKSIDDVDTKNNAVFLKCVNESIDKLKIEVGLRYDDTTISSPSATQDNEYKETSGNAVLTYAPNIDTKYYIGIGQSNRVPDARELYNLGKKATPTATTQMEIGTPDLEVVTNNEIDFGLSHNYENASVKANFFYSDLKNYIYYNKTATKNRFENIDATISGLSLNGSYYINDTLTLDLGYSMKKGEKKEVLTGQSDKDLADITPPKTTLALTYDYDENTMAMVEFVTVSDWKDYDSDNGEQAIDGFNVVNIKASRVYKKNFEITVGIDNLFDETYAVSNTYADLILLTDGTTQDVMLLNEPGRYVYTNIKYKF